MLFAMYFLKHRYSTHFIQK